MGFWYVLMVTEPAGMSWMCVGLGKHLRERIPGIPIQVAPHLWKEFVHYMKCA
jgi:hypothetical protein